MLAVVENPLALAVAAVALAAPEEDTAEDGSTDATRL